MPRVDRAYNTLYCGAQVSVIIDENTSGDDSDVQKEELVCNQLDDEIHEDINKLKSLLEDVKESFKTTYIICLDGLQIHTQRVLGFWILLHYKTCCRVLFKVERKMMRDMESIKNSNMLSVII